ncbi:MAG TPA: adenylate/guanylate cyclase domain-containing protein, partial [Methylomirabilota bacterium]|nr:adenylate/guanylate cyclase domain-containing protein [Methylomirabilota bacterium]
MRCRDCGQESREGARFCEECGARLETVCPACGVAVSATARFCSGCGQPVVHHLPPPIPFVAPERYTPGHLAARILTSRAALEGERKQITVLFADMRGSLELMSDMDPEESRRLLDPVLTLMMDAVHRHEGTVNQVLGDGIMALFGAPLAHEDHAARACLASLDIQEAIAHHVTTLPPRIGGVLQVRIGLNSGEVVVRSIGNDLHMDFTAVGQTTHLAHRMEQLARPGTICITGATARLAEGVVEVSPLGPTPIKGLVEPVEVFEVLRVGPHRTRLEVSRARALTRFIGREAELANLRRAAEQAARGHGQVVAVVGEAGVGKSRLLFEFTRSYCPPGWRVLEIGTVVYVRSRGRVPVLDLVRALFSIEEDDDREAIAAKVEAGLPDGDDAREVILAALLGTLDPELGGAVWQDLEPAQRRQYMLEGVTRVVAAQTAVEPLCLVVEDLHWVDTETQALLDRLVEMLPNTRLLLVVTYRPEYRHGWGSRSYYAQLPVGPLGRAGAEALLGDLLGADASLGGIKRVLVERTDGNPFFLEECVHDLAEKRVLSGPRGAHQLARAAPSLEVPATVQAVLASRIDRLPPMQKEVLQAAAVIGKDVPLPLLGAAVALEPRALEASVRALQAGEFLYEGVRAPVPEVTFKHVLTRDVAFGGLVAERRRVLDGRVIEAIERLHPDRLADHVESLALHAHRAEAWERAVHYCREAGRRAFARSNHRAAVEYFEQALDALDHVPLSPETTAQAIDLRLDLRYALTPLGEFDRIHAHLTEAGELARRAGDQQRLCVVSAFLTNYYHLMGDLARAVATGEAALPIAAKEKEPQARILLNAYLGWAYLTQGHYAKAIGVSRANLEMLRGALERERFGAASPPSVYSRTCLASALAEMGELEEAEHVAADGLRIADEMGHRFSLIYAHLGVGTVHLVRGDHAAAIAVLERALALCREGQIPLLASMAALALTSAYVEGGRAADALGALKEIGGVGAAIGDPVERRVSAGA